MKHGICYAYWEGDSFKYIEKAATLGFDEEKMDANGRAAVVFLRAILDGVAK